MDARSCLKGVVAGATLMYYLDPDRGARRRGRIRDRLVHLNRMLEDGLSAAGRDARNRATGMAARARRRLRRDDATDVVVEQRVRSQIGRYVSHPRAIEVSARDGRVALSGPILEDEVRPLIRATRSVQGVDEVDDRLERHESPGDVPALQGDERRREPRAELMQEHWTPALRAAVGGLGAVALVAGRRMSGPLGTATGVVGGALLARAATNLPTRRLVGVNAGRKAVTFSKTITVGAPVQEVWRLWSRFEDFPRFMAHLEEVRETGEGRSHWVARGPAGTRFEWDAEVTRWEPDEMIAWRSVEGATVANAGRVRFQPEDEGRTRIDVQFSYNPPAGAVGHAVASLFGGDPKRAMDEDLVRLKSLLEQGKASVSGETVRREEIRR